MPPSGYHHSEEGRDPSVRGLPRGGGGGEREQGHLQGGCRVHQWRGV